MLFVVSIFIFIKSTFKYKALSIKDLFGGKLNAIEVLYAVVRTPLNNCHECGHITLANILPYSGKG